MVAIIKKRILVMEMFAGAVEISPTTALNVISEHILILKRGR